MAAVLCLIDCVFKVHLIQKVNQVSAEECKNKSKNGGYVEYFQKYFLVYIMNNNNLEYSKNEA
jgi:hypothetical protein